MKELEITVCQGIGDIFWVYQQFAPYVDVLRFEIAHVPGNNVKIATRAVEFIRSLSKVTGVVNKVVSADEYTALASGRFDAEKVLREGGGLFASNAALESGVRLEAICPALPPQETVAIPVRPTPLPPEFIALYVSEGSSLSHVIRDVGVWTIEQWVEFVEGFYEKFEPGLPLIVIGAEYDRKAIEPLAASLAHLTPDVRIGLPMKEVCYLLSKASMFLGYQSGLNIIADQFDTPQVMLYFESNRNMLQSWPKMRNLDSGIHRPFVFTQSPRDVVEAITWKPSARI